ncbi:hypothetical protein F5051DRAFT_474294 [Lentinula edodes]|nr:hypothetical protein F5051DRAFT_474294 [Lentinula edodes]
MWEIQRLNYSMKSPEDFKFTYSNVHTGQLHDHFFRLLQLPFVNGRCDFRRQNVMNNQSRMVANYVVVAGSTLWIAEFIETLPTEIDSIWIHVPLGFDISGAKGVTGKWDKQGIEALEPGISTVGSPFQILSRCKTNPKGELPLKMEIGIPFVVFGYDLFIFILTVRETVHHAINMHRLCPGQSSIAQIIVRDGTLYFLATLVLAAIDSILLILLKADPLSDVVGPFFNVFSNLLISRLMLNLQTFTTSTITTSQGAASTGQSSSLHFAQRMLGNRNIGGTLDGDFIGEEIEFE